MIVVHVKEKKRATLAQAVANKIQCPVIPVSVDHFADGETHIPHFNSRAITGQNVILVHQFFSAQEHINLSQNATTNHPINQQILDLLILIKYLKACRAQRITTLLPYMPFARQDQTIERSSQSILSFLSSFLEQSGVNTVLCSDIHSPHAHKFFNIPFESIGLEFFWANYIKTNIVKLDTQNACIATPDLGGKGRAQTIAQILGLPLIVAEKKRVITNHAIALKITGDVQGKKVILVDDILATGRTAITTCDLLKEKGAKEIIGCFSHAVFAPGTSSRLIQSSFDKIYIADTVLIGLTPEMAQKIHAVSVYDFLSTHVHKFLNIDASTSSA